MADKDKASAAAVEKKKDVPFNELVETLEKRIQSGDGDLVFT